MTDFLHCTRNREGLQSEAAVNAELADFFQTLRKRNGREIVTVIECIIANLGHSLRNRYKGQVVMIIKCMAADDRNLFSGDLCRNLHFDSFIAAPGDLNMVIIHNHIGEILEGLLLAVLCIYSSRNNRKIRDGRCEHHCRHTNGRKTFHG